MGGHGHGAPYKVPPYNSFTVDGIPQLDELQKALEKKGLKDPWIRNEAWRYNPGFGGKMQRINKTFFRGFPLGFGLALITVAVTKAFSSGDDHGHH